MAKKELSKEELKARGKLADLSGNESDMVAKIIAAIRPDDYSNNAKDVKKIIDGGDFWQAVNAVKLKSQEKDSDPEEHKLMYDSSSETLEPVYFWLLDLGRNTGLKFEKFLDNFSSSPGSGYFGEMGLRSGKMQEEASKSMQTIGVLIKSLVNIIYDLREFQIRISQYDKMKSSSGIEREAAMLALKQIWMDNVDIKKGNGSINALASGNLMFVTLRDAFMKADKVSDVDKMDLNDRVKRILEPRVQEFNLWIGVSEAEIRKRYAIEKSYLKSQVSSLKMYTRWAKPYLKAATQLEQAQSSDAGLVNAFSTAILQLSILGTTEFKFMDAVYDKQFSDYFREKTLKRPYYSCVLIDFYFRGIPQRTQQGYIFGGKVDVKFRAYALNSDELDILRKAFDESDLNDALTLASGMTDESLDTLRKDIEFFVEGKDDKSEKEKKEEKKSSSDDSNPFKELFSGFTDMFKKEDKKGSEEREVIKLLKKLKGDDYVEKTVRTKVQSDANGRCFGLFDVYKKAHDMASHPAPEWM